MKLILGRFLVITQGHLSAMSEKLFRSLVLILKLILIYMDFPTIFLSFEYSEFSIAAIAAAGYIEFIQIMMVWGCLYRERQ